MKTQKSTLPPQFVENFRTELERFLDADDFDRLSGQTGIFARLAAEALLNDDFGYAVGWAELHAEGNRLTSELFARRKAVA